MALDVRVGFSTTNKWQSSVIRWLTRAPCSHAWISFYDETLDMRLVMQAEVWGYELRPWNRWLRENILVDQFELVGQGDNLVGPLREIATELGSKYDFKSAVWVGIRGWFKRWFKARLSIRPSRTPHKLMCSEAVIRFLRKSRYFLARRLRPELTSPGDLWKYFCSRPNVFKRIEKP